MIQTDYKGACDALFPLWDLDEIQALGFDKSGHMLTSDGKEGPLTRSGYFLIPSGDEPALVAAMLAFARQGIRETEGNNAGPMVAQMFGLDPVAHGKRGLGAWCAACVSRALINARVSPDFSMIKGARRLTDYFDARGRSVALSSIAPGDIVSWAVPRDDAPYGGHIGVVCHVDGDEVFVLEGNGGARHGRVRIYRYSKKDGLAYGRGRHGLWKIVRPA